MAELGQTDNPSALIAGDPGAIYTTAAALQAYGDLLQLAGEGLARIDTAAGWTGTAADAFRKVFHGQPDKWLQAGEAFHDAATALNGYAETLASALGRAGDAIDLWASGSAHHAAAQALLAAARSEVSSSGAAANTTVGKARDLAPPAPSFWSRVGSDLDSALHGAEHVVEDVGDALINDAASVGNSVAHNFLDDLETVGGAALTVLSGAGEVGGTVLDATGVGAIVGVPLQALSAAGIATGVTLAGVGITGILSGAAGPDGVSIMHSESSGGSGSESPTPSSYTSNVGKADQRRDPRRQGVRWLARDRGQQEPGRGHRHEHRRSLRTDAERRGLRREHREHPR
jgi:uncharacterized protein YukE